MQEPHLRLSRILGWTPSRDRVCARHCHADVDAVSEDAQNGVLIRDAEAFEPDVARMEMCRGCALAL
jgi:hypothetical protein